MRCFSAYYVAYTLFVLLNAVEHDALPFYTRIMFTFVVPITLLTLVVLAARGIRLHRRGGSLLQPEPASAVDGAQRPAADQ